MLRSIYNDEKIDITFNTEKENEKYFQIASGYISETTILFEKDLKCIFFPQTD